MIKNLLITAFRNILKNKVSTLINILGLIIGITCCLIIYTKIRYERSYDSFHSDTERIYRKVRLTSNLEYLQGDIEYRAGTFFAFPQAIRNEVPEVETVSIVLYMKGGGSVAIPDPNEKNGVKIFKEEDGLVLVEPEFFRIFDFKKAPLKWIYGSPEKSLNEPYSVVLTKTMAEKYFKNKNPVGQTLKFFGEASLTVTGIVSDFPDNSNFPFKILGSFSTFTAMNPGILNAWYGLNDFYQCFVKLKPNVSRQDVEQKMKTMHGNHTNGNMNEERLFKLQPLRQMHEDENFIDHNFKRAIFSREVLLTLTFIIIFLVFIISVNYNNMAIAVSSSRSREVGVRKVMGSKRKHLFFQFYGESFVLIFISIILGILLANLLLNLFFQFFGLPEGTALQFNLTTTLILLGFLIVINILSGLYPAVVLSGFLPTQIFQRKPSSVINKSFNFSKAAVLLQFIIANIMIVGVILIYKQIFYINHKDIGFQKKGILTVELPDNNENKMSRFANQLSQQTNIEKISFSSSSPATTEGFGGGEYINDNIRYEILAGVKFIDTAYISTYGLKLLYGRSFSKTDAGFNIIVNEELIREIGIKKTWLALGEVINFYGNNRATIIGIVKDFHTNSFHEKIRPSVLINNPNGFRMAGIKFHLTGTNRKKVNSSVESVIKAVKKEWEDVYHGDIFTYKFLEDPISDYYENERRFAKIVNLFTVLIIFISCLGILGLSFYTIKRKNKEIAIKKTHGALTYQILSIFSLEYLKLVLISLMISTPVAFYVMSKWLDNFAYKTSVSWWVFITSGAIVFLISMTTILWQCWQAANKNPVEALRYE